MCLHKYILQNTIQEDAAGVHINILHDRGHTGVIVMSCSAEYTGICSQQTAFPSSPLLLYVSSSEPTKPVVETVHCFLLCCTTQKVLTFTNKKNLAVTVRSDKEIPIVESSTELLPTLGEVCLPLSVP